MKRKTKAISGNLKIIHRYRTAQAMLLKGCTVAELSQALSLSPKSARRLINDFIADGCEVESSFVRGTQEAAVFRLMGKKEGRSGPVPEEGKCLLIEDTTERRDTITDSSKERYFHLSRTKGI